MMTGMTTQRNARTAEEWAEYLTRRQADVRELQQRIAAGEDEVSAARGLGFGTRSDLACRIAAAKAAR